jgi:hypothetical protein
MLLMIVRGAKDYKDIRTYNGKLYQTSKEACAARRLLKDDKEWYDTFCEAANWATTGQLRYLFFTMVLYCNLQDERKFYEHNWRKMTDDIERQLIKKYEPYSPIDIELHDILLEELEGIFSKNGIYMYHYNLPHKSAQYHIHANNKLIEEELNYDFDKLEKEFNQLYQQLNNDQKMRFMA